MAPAADKKGLKRICPSCGTRYYDFNKRPAICPECDTEFSLEAKVKTRRRAAANDEDSEIVKVKAVETVKEDNTEEDEEIVARGDEVVSLEDVDDGDDDKDEEEVEVEVVADLEIDDDIDDADDDDDDDLDDEEDDEDDEE